MDLQPKVSLVEILVVVAIIALVGVLASVAVTSARSKQRDATRLSNVRQIQTALEDYFNENNTYPDGELMPLGDSAQSACLSVTGFHADCSTETATIIRIVPRTYEAGLPGKVACGTPARKAFCYSALNQGDAYAIQFELENSLPGAGLQKGINCAVPGKMAAGVCE
jgi:type II secretory pathway pseudopilin PulG